MGSWVDAAVSVVSAPVTAVQSIASGGNVGEALNQGVAQTMAGTHQMVAGPGDTILKPLADKTGISQLPIVRNYYDEGRAAQEIVQSSSEGRIASRGQSMSLYRNAAEVGSVVAGGFAAAPYLGAASSGELAGYASLGGAGLNLANGKPAAALSALSGAVGLDEYGIDLGDLVGSAGSPSNPKNPVRAPGGAIISGAGPTPVTPSQMAGVGLMAALVGAVYLLRKR